jgi:regulator of RNase E activity RraA
LSPNDLVFVARGCSVLIPAALLDDVVEAAVEQERLEGWIMDEVNRGSVLPGLYPPNAENLARYKAWAEKLPPP